MRSKTFTIGFLLGFALFVTANLYSYNQMRMPCADCYMSFGVPFEIWRAGGFVSITQILWAGLIADVSLAICASLILGWAFAKLIGSQRRLP